MTFQDSLSVLSVGAIYYLGPGKHELNLPDRDQVQEKHELNLPDRESFYFCLLVAPSIIPSYPCMLLSPPWGVVMMISWPLWGLIFNFIFIF